MLVPCDPYDVLLSYSSNLSTLSIVACFFALKQGFASFLWCSRRGYTHWLMHVVWVMHLKSEGYSAVDQIPAFPMG